MLANPISQSPKTQNLATIRVTLGENDLTDAIHPRLISASISEKRGEKADQLDLVLHDHDGQLAIPPYGALLNVQLGWIAGGDVVIGLVDKGQFKVDELKHSGPPDILTITARAANLTAAYRVRKDKAHIDTTLGTILTTIANTNGWTAHIDPALAAIAVPVLGQSAQSDMEFVRNLGRKYNATATIKNDVLIFAPIGTGQTASGKTMPILTLTRQSGDQHTWSRTARDQYDGVEAQYHDQDSASRQSVTANASGTGPPRRLKKIHANRQDAQAHADAHANQIDQRAYEFEYSLALGRPDLAVEQVVTLQGWKPEIDGHIWVIAEVTHKLDASGGLTSDLKLETKA